MKVVDFINKLEELGYDDNTEINFGECDYDGNWYEFGIEDFDGEDSNNISILFYENEDYNKAILSGMYDDLVSDFKVMLAEYC